MYQPIEDTEARAIHDRRNAEITAMKAALSTPAAGRFDPRADVIPFKAKPKPVSPRDPAPLKRAATLTADDPKLALELRQLSRARLGDLLLKAVRR